MGSFRIILIALLALVVLVLLLRAQLPVFQPQTQLVLPMDLQEIIPTSWSVIPEEYQQCDFDGDGEPEWLVVYSYDQTTVATAAGETAQSVRRAAIGGVIYDSQVNRVPQEPGSESPYRPSFLFPYKLLPAIYPGQGQGYLGESGVAVYFSPLVADEGQCSTGEIAVLGYSDSPLPTRLSLFRWRDADQGYRNVHFVGDAQVKTDPNPASGQPVREIFTYNRFNERTRLCEVRGYRRQDPLQDLNFIEDHSLYTIDFCFEAPPDPAYPEGVVVALLRGNNPAFTDTPTGSSFLTAEAREELRNQLPELGNETRDPYRIMALEYWGTLAGYPGSGTVADETEPAWVWGNEGIKIRSTIVVDGMPREITWRLTSLADERTRANVYWRVDSVTMP